MRIRLDRQFKISCFDVVIILCKWCVHIHRQVCDIWQPQGQLGSWRDRSKQRHISHAGNYQGAGQDGQTG